MSLEKTDLIVLKNQKKLPRQHSQQSRDLNQPTHVVGINVGLDGPLGQLVPLLPVLPVDAQTQLDVLIFGLLEVAGDLLDDPGEVLPVQVIVGLQEDLAEPAFPDRVVLGVELVETVERVPVRVHVQHVDRQVVGGQVHGLKRGKLGVAVGAF